MSLPSNNAHPMLSSSSSRQSLHSRTDTPTRPATSPRPPSDRNQAAREDHSTKEQPANEITPSTNDGAGSKDTSEAQEPQTTTNPPFQPFFTLIEDAHTSEYYHPTVHYIFSDDDTDIVTEAALRSLEAQQESLPDSKREQAIEGQSKEEEGGPSSSPRKSSLLPPPAPGVREHYIILDVTQDGTLQNANSGIAEPSAVAATKGGDDVTKSLSSSPANNPPATPGPPAALPTAQFSVSSAQSLAPTWQVLNSELVPAPTFENSNPGDTPGHGLMLKIRGTAGLPPSAPKDKDKAGGERGSQRLEEMMDQFAKRMSELQTVIEAGEATAPLAAAEGGEQGAESHTRDEGGSTEVAKDDGESGSHVSGDGEHS
jgi:hypothetical protein